MGGFFGRGNRGIMAVELTPDQLEALGISVNDWAKLPGQLRDEVLQAASDSAPPEYRTLIKQYFQEVARAAGRKKRNSHRDTENSEKKSEYKKETYIASCPYGLFADRYWLAASGESRAPTRRARPWPRTSKPIDEAIDKALAFLSKKQKPGTARSRARWRATWPSRRFR